MINQNAKMNFSDFSNTSNPKIALTQAAVSQLTYRIEKYGISDFTGKKNYTSRYFCSVFTFLILLKLDVEISPK